MVSMDTIKRFFTCPMAAHFSSIDRLFEFAQKNILKSNSILKDFDSFDSKN